MPAGRQRHLGEFELLVLAALFQLEDAAYGVAIRREIETRTGRQVSVGALYATLSRLEDKSYIQSRMGESTAKRGGRAKRYYKLTALGQVEFDRSITAFNKMFSGLSQWKQVPDS